MTAEKITELTQHQRDRLAFIELRVRFVGEIRRQDLVARFGIQAAAATRDIAQYKEIAPRNLDYDTKGKVYVRGKWFRPAFEFPVERVLTWLSQGYGDGEPLRLKSFVSCEGPALLNKLDLETLSVLTRAIHQKGAIEISYRALSSGLTKREIVPFALADNGQRWHVRAFDRRSGEFRDFVLARIADAQIVTGNVGEQETSDQDIQWNRITELELVPHPANVQHPDTIEAELLKLEEIQKNAAISGMEPGHVVRIVTTEPVGDNALTVYYKTADGKLLERMLFRTDEANLSLAEAGRPWAFDAPGEEFKLAAEAYRINLAHLFDPMMAVHTSNVEPLPHQITAVYESMLPRQPLRYVLADDPGAGKTIMAGLFIRELLMRADAKRVLIVAPGSLVEQWQDEMFEKFGLSFTLFSREQVEQSRSGNPFDDIDLMVARVDQLSRAEDLQEKLRLSHWDLIVVDEAHKLSASYFGNKVNKTKRFQLGELLGSITRHFLLMTATPHNGKEEDFQLFMSLLDADRFYGKFRDGAHKVDVSDLMRRMVKEDLLKFDGTPLFPERRAYTVNYKLSDLEAALYAAVTDYVKTELNRADQLETARARAPSASR
jgi:predicted DNA-binding transcriptional regulator YafY